MDQISENLHKATQNIADSARNAGRTAAAVTLIAVSKTHAIGAIEQAIASGQRVFGENRVQEAATKFPALKAKFPDIELHLIGPLQTNKVAEAVALFDVIQTLDRPKLAKALAKEIKKQGRAPRLYIEVNTGHEPQKAGLAPKDVGPFLILCRNELGLKIDGLMCIPPFNQDPTPHFTLLKELADKLSLDKLSMGMSGDYETAVAVGATHVRIGTAIFGNRPFSMNHKKDNNSP